MCELQKTISVNKRMLECYELRLHLIDRDKINKTDYDLNEDEIIKIKTESMIVGLRNKISTLEDDFINLLNR